MEPRERVSLIEDSEPNKSHCGIVKRFINFIFRKGHCMSRNQELAGSYEELAFACGIHVGDKVRMVRPYNAFELGSACDWANASKRFVGKEHVVQDINDNGSFKLADGAGYVWVPFFVLDKVAAPVQKLTVAEISKRLGVTVEVVKG